MSSQINEVPAQTEGGATILEITQQPDAWREITQRDHTPSARLLDRMLERPDLRVILTGAGSSAFGGEVVAAALRRHLNRRVEAIATTSIVANPLDHLERRTPTLLVSFARSGNSPESVAATRLADQLIDDVAHLVLSCDGAGDLARHHTGRDDSAVVLMPERTNDTGFAMTSSLTSMMLTCLRLLGGTTAATVELLATAAEQLCERRAAIRMLARAGHHRIVYLGSGPLEGLARESALKLLELTSGEVDTYFDSPLGFRHGPKSVLDDDTLVVVYVSTDPYTRRYDIDIITELRRQLGTDRVVVIATAAAGVDTVWTLPGLDGLADSEIGLAYLVFAQHLALFTALERGKTPDNPFPAGEVNRVVKGVTIYPMSDR